MDNTQTTLQNRLKSISVVKTIPYNDTFNMTVYSDGLLKFEDEVEYFFIDNGLLLKAFNKQEQKDKEQKDTKREQQSSANTVAVDDLAKIFVNLFNNKVTANETDSAQRSKETEDTFIPKRDFSSPAPMQDIKTALDFMDKK